MPGAEELDPTLEEEASRGSFFEAVKQAVRRIDRGGAPFWQALFALIASIFVTFGLTLSSIFAHYRETFRQIENFPYTRRPTGRPLSWPTRAELGFGPDTNTVSHTLSLQQLFEAGAQAVRNGEKQQAAYFLEQILQLDRGSLVSTLLDDHINAPNVCEQFFAAFIAAQRLIRRGQPPGNMLSNSSVQAFASNLVNRIDLAPSAETIMDGLIEVFGRDGAVAVLQSLGSRPSLRNHAKSSLLRTAVGRSVFFEFAVINDPLETITLLAPKVSAGDADWVALELGKREGEQLSVLAALFGRLYEGEGLFGDVLDGTLRGHVQEQLANAEGRALDVAILALGSIHRPWATDLLLQRLAMTDSLGELPYLNMALINHLDAGNSSELAAIIADSRASLAAKTYATLMLINLSFRLEDRSIWTPSQEMGLRVLQQALDSQDGNLKKASFAVLIREGFVEGKALVRKLLREPGEHGRQMFLVSNLRNLPEFHADLKAVADDETQPEAVRRLIRQFLPS